MQITAVTGLRWADEAQTMLDCTLETVALGTLPFTAIAGDSEAHSRDIFARAMAGEYGAIGAYVAPPVEETGPIVPQSITPRQLKLALLEAGLLDAIEEFVAAAPREVQIGWNNTIEYLRTDTLLNEMATAFGMNAEQVDGIFVAAAVK